MSPLDRKRNDGDELRVFPPVDLNTPVTNPKLVAAIDAFANEQGESQLNDLLTELNDAVYLVATVLDEAHIAESATQGNVVFEKGSLIKVITTSDPEGNPLLPLFTDWDAIRSWSEDPLQTFVMPAADAWAFALGDYHGAIINPAGPALPLNRSQTELLLQGKKAT